jgi:hypothetical protein
MMISRNRARMASASLAVLSAGLMIGAYIIENSPTARATLLSMIVLILGATGVLVARK